MRVRLIIGKKEAALSTEGLVDFEEEMIIEELKEVEGAKRGQQPGSSLTRPCAANVQRAPLLLQGRGEVRGTRYQSSVPLGTALGGARVKMEARSNRP